MSTTADLSEFIAGLDASDIPADVMHQAKRCLIDWLGVTLAGSAEPSAEVLHSVAGELGSGRTATVLGAGYETTLLFAALSNGYAAHVLDYDDTYNPARTTVHPSAPVWPVVLAMAERNRLDGRKALTALVAGFETEVRIALAAGPSHYEAGWHVTGTVGHFGAAAAAARLLDLDARQVANALGAAGTQAAGLKGVYGTMGKPLHPGKAAMDGILAAFLAQNGFTASTSILESERGFLRVYSADPEPQLVTNDLGARWTLLDNGFKPYACGSLTHPTIEAVIGLCQDHHLAPDQIESVHATVNDYVSWVTGKSEPATGLEGKFSIFHSAAVAAVDGMASTGQFTDARVNDPAIVAMRERTSIAVDDDLPKDAAKVELVLTDGRQVTREVLHNKGTPAKPMTDEEIEAKFTDLVTPCLGAATAGRLVEMCWQLDEHADVAEIARLAKGT